jgi:hypothetical protein
MGLDENRPPLKLKYDVVALPPVNWGMHPKWKEFCQAVSPEERSSGWYHLECRCDNCKKLIRVHLHKGLRLDHAIEKKRVSCPHCNCIVLKLKEKK